MGYGSVENIALYKSQRYLFTLLFAGICCQLILRNYNLYVFLTTTYHKISFIKYVGNRPEKEYWSKNSIRFENTECVCDLSPQAQYQSQRKSGTKLAALSLLLYQYEVRILRDYSRDVLKSFPTIIRIVSWGNAEDSNIRIFKFLYFNNPK